MYTKGQESIRNSVWQLLGAIMNNAPDTQIGRENSVALMSEELCKFCKTGDRTINIQSAKPILKAAHWILQMRYEEINSIENKNEEIIKTLKGLEVLITSLDVYINKIK